MQQQQTQFLEGHMLYSHSFLQPILGQKAQSHNCTAGYTQRAQQAESQSGLNSQRISNPAQSADAR